jgi:DNA invertase Pin-like site-specific DNA recombinase
MHFEKLVSKPIDYIHVYTRVSTGKQSTDKKLGLSSQKDVCDKYINKYYANFGLTEIRYHSDIGSSYKNDRILSDMKTMIYKLKSNSLILISEVSRLGRSYKMVESLLKIIKKKKSFIVSVSQNLIFGKTKILDKTFIQKVIESEKESDILSMRTKNIQAYIKNKGGYIGKPPFGYTIKKDFRNIPVLKEKIEDFELIDAIVDLSNECCSYEEIKDKMNNKNLLHKNKLWTCKKIQNILNKFYPEHMLLNINSKNEKVILVDDSEKISVRLENKESTLSERVKNTKFGNLKITIYNNVRNVSFTPSSSIKLRSGRVINKF